MSSYSYTLTALARDEREAEMAIDARLQSMLNAKTPPSDSSIARLAGHHTAPRATAQLLEMIRSLVPGNFGTTAIVTMFMHPHDRLDIRAHTCGVRLGCWPQRGDYLPDPLDKLRARKDARAVVARYACGDLRSWTRADMAARAIMILRRLVPASIEARRHG